jgi:hypothetical protein
VFKFMSLKGKLEHWHISPRLAKNNKVNEIAVVGWCIRMCPMCALI